MKDRQGSRLRIALTVMGMLWVCGAVAVLGDTSDPCCRLDREEERKEYLRESYFREVGQRGGGEGVFIALPGSEERVLIRTVDIPFDVFGSGEIELTLVVLGHGHEESSAQIWVDGVPAGALYRKRFRSTNPGRLHVSLELNIPRLEMEALVSTTRGRWWEHPNFTDYDLLITLRRVDSDCKMSAVVSGDLSGFHNGDMAYFNLFGPGEGVRNELASGNAADEGTHDTLQGFMEMGGGMLEVLDDLGVEVDPETRAAMEQAGGDGQSEGGEEAEVPSELEQWESAIRHSGDNNFGLTLTAVQHAQGSESETYGGDSAASALSGLGEAMEALGAFSLGLSGKGSVAETIEDLGDIAVTSLWVAPGARDANVESAKFYWEEGLPGQVRLSMDPLTGGLLEGRLEARVRSDKKYDGRYLWITVQAEFLAREGFHSCAE